MPHVLMLIDTSGPGGAETVLRDLTSGLAQKGVTSICVVSREDWLSNQLRQLGIKVYIKYQKSLFDFSYLKFLIKLVNQYSITHIHGHLFGSIVNAAILGKILSRPAIGTIHGANDLLGVGRFSTLKFWLANRYCRLIAVSPDLSALVKQNHNLNASVIPNGISIEKFAGLQNSRDNEDAIVIGAIGNIRAAKSYESLIETAIELSRIDFSRKYKFVVAGGGGLELLAKLQHLVNEAGLENVHFIGFVDDVQEFLSNIDIYLLTSKSEGFSLTCLQAMASLTPVIATRCGGPEQFLSHRNNSFLCDVGDTRALAEAIVELSTSSHLVERLSSAAFRVVKSQYSVDAMVDRYLDCYMNCE